MKNSNFRNTYASECLVLLIYSFNEHSAFFLCSQNNGTCVDGVLNYTCECYGYIGRHCEIGRITVYDFTIMIVVVTIVIM